MDIGYKWVPSNITRSVPRTAMIGGKDLDESTIYICRAKYNGDMLPGKFVPARQEAYVSYGCEEHKVEDFEILCQKDFEWVPAAHGNVHPAAVVTGCTVDGESLYTGRAHHNDTLTLGKIHPSHQCLYIPFGGEEHRYTQYEVLVYH